MDEKQMITRFAEHLLETAKNEVDMCNSAMHNITGLRLGVDSVARIENACISLEASAQSLRRELTQKFKDIEQLTK